jgi:hypothetical protein
MDREEEIREIAYHLWDLEGRCEGHNLEYWLIAEAIWAINHSADTQGKIDETISHAANDG